MLTRFRIEQIVAQLRYKDGWTFRVSERGGDLVLQLAFDAPDNDTGEMTEQKSRKWLLSRHMTESEIVQTAWLAVQTAEMHEAREQFMYQGRAIFGPHFDVNALVALCDTGATEHREPVAAT